MPVQGRFALVTGGPRRWAVMMFVACLVHGADGFLVAPFARVSAALTKRAVQRPAGMKAGSLYMHMYVHTYCICPVHA